MGQFSGTYVLWTTGLITFNFGMFSHVYRGHKICKVDGNQPSGYRVGLDTISILSRNGNIRVSNIGIAVYL